MKGHSAAGCGRANGTVTAGLRLLPEARATLVETSAVYAEMNGASVETYCHCPGSLGYKAHCMQRNGRDRGGQTAMAMAMAMD